MVLAFGDVSRRPVRRLAGSPAPVARVVALGGGTGLPVLLRGLKVTLFPTEWRSMPVRGRDYLTAIVTVADDGGSSGRLRKAYGVLAPGDVRSCLLALSDGDPTLAAIFGFRFNGRGDVSGHSLGNLILTALSELESQFPRAVERAADILGARGRVLPSTGANVRLLAELADGRRVQGESRIASAGGAVRRVLIEPEDARALPQALDAIGAADLVVIGPGSLYTSLMPVLLVREVADAIARSTARVVLVMNLMTEPGETDGFTALDHLLAIRRHAPQVPIHDVLLNDAPIPAERVWAYAEDGAQPVRLQAEALRAHGCRLWRRDLLAAAEGEIRHDPCKLAAAVIEVGRAGRRRNAAKALEA